MPFAPTTPRTTTTSGAPPAQCPAPPPRTPPAPLPPDSPRARAAQAARALDAAPPTLPPATAPATAATAGPTAASEAAAAAAAGASRHLPPWTHGLVDDDRIGVQWLAAPTPTPDDIAMLRQIRNVIEAQDEGPFISGLLNFPTVARALHRAGGHVAALPHIPFRLLDAIADRVSTDKPDVPTDEAVSLLGLLPRATRRQVTAELRKEVDSAVAVGALAEVAVLRAVAPLFVIRQGTRDRLIYDLRVLNHLITGNQFFGMETVFDVPNVAHGCRVGGKLDLRSAYWQYPLDDDLSSLLGVDIDGREYAWRALPFGLDVAPKAWTALLAPFVAAWRRKGIRVIAYLDDIALFAPDTHTYAQHAAVIVRDLVAAGIRISAPKAFLIPLQVFEFLGVTVDLRDGGSFFVSNDRIDRLERDAAALLDGGPPDAYNVAEFLGRATFASVVCPWLSYYRTSVVAALTAACPGGQLPRRVGGRLAGLPVALGDDARAELSWWATEARHLLSQRWPWLDLATTTSFVSRRVTQPTSSTSATAATDASETGIGLRLPVFDESGNQLSLGDIASEPLPSWLPPSSPSTARELYGLARLVEVGRLRPRPGEALRLVTDSQAAAWSWAGASATPATARAARRLFSAAVDAGVPIIVDWSPRELLADCDAGSRVFERDASHAMPNRAWARSRLLDLVGEEPSRELFASAASRLFPMASHGSRLPDPSAPLGNGLAHRAWHGPGVGWVFPPFALHRLVLLRLLAFHQTSTNVALLPDRPSTQLLAASHLILPGPTSLLAPPDFVRSMRPPLGLVLCVPRRALRAARQPPTALPPSQPPSIRQPQEPPQQPQPTALRPPQPPLASHRPPQAPLASHRPSQPSPASSRPPPPQRQPTTTSPSAPPPVTAGSAAPPAHPRAPAAVPRAPAAVPSPSSWTERSGDALRGAARDAAHVLHCVSARAELGAGFARQVSTDECSRAELQRVRALAIGFAVDGDCDSVRPGVVWSPRSGDARLGHLVTKRTADHLPRIEVVIAAFAAALEALQDSPLRVIHMPRIGCGLDRLSWDRLAPRLRRVLSRHDDLHVVVFTPP